MMLRSAPVPVCRVRTPAAMAALVPEELESVAAPAAMTAFWTPLARSMAFARSCDRARRGAGRADVDGGVAVAVGDDVAADAGAGRSRRRRRDRARLEGDGLAVDGQGLAVGRRAVGRNGGGAGRTGQGQGRRQGWRRCRHRRRLQRQPAWRRCRRASCAATAAEVPPAAPENSTLEDAVALV